MDPAQPEPMSFAIDAIAFDSDGVLIDSLAGVERAWRRWAADLGLDPDSVMASIHGRPSRDIVERLIPATRRAAALARIDGYEIADATIGVQAMPGAAALLASLPTGRWAIVTSASRELFMARLAATGLPVPAVTVTSDDVTNGKPSPEGYLAAFAGLGVDPSRGAIFEDSDGGLAAATAAGAGTVIRVGSLEPGPGQAAAVGDLRSVSWDDGRLVVRHVPGDKQSARRNRDH